MPASNFWSPAPTAYPGSSGYVTGQQNPDPYGISWDPVNRRVVSNDPSIPGYTPFGVRKTTGMTFPTSVNSLGVNPYANLLNGALGSNGPGSPGTPPGTKTLLGGVTGSMGTTAGGYNPLAPPGQGYNPFFTVQNQKDPTVASQLAQILGQYNVMQGLNPTDTVTQAMAAQDPNYKQYLGQETGAVGQWFPSTPGGKSAIQTQLDALAAQRAAAYQTATNRAMDALSKQQALQQMSMGGAGTVGGGSYLQKQGLDTAAGLNVAQGLDAATQARNDLMTVLQGQQQNLGTRAGLTTGDITRQLLPSQVGSDWFNKMMTTLMPILQQQLGNNFYGLGQAGQSPGVSFPGMSAGSVGGGGGNSPQIRPAAAYQPGSNPAVQQLLQMLMGRGGAGAGGMGIPGATTPLLMPPGAMPGSPGNIDYGNTVPNYGYWGTGQADSAPQNQPDTSFYDPSAIYT